MGKKGFTIIELVTSLTLATIIMIFLFNLVFILKDVYISSENNSTLLIEQAAISEEVNSFLYKNEVTSISKCTEGDVCINIKTNDETKIFKVTKSSKKIEFGNYLYKVKEDSLIKFGDVKVCYKKVSDASGYNKILYIDVPITYNNKNTNYGLKSATLLKRNTPVGEVAECQ